MTHQRYANESIKLEGVFTLLGEEKINQFNKICKRNPRGRQRRILN